jgi:Phage gp6-like head-tail connector protein
MAYVSYLTLADAKAHLRVTIDDDDALIQNQINAAEDWLADYLGGDSGLFGYASPPVGGANGTLPPKIMEAIRQLVSFLYDNRAAAVVGNTITVTNMSPGFYDLLASSRDYVF